MSPEHRRAYRASDEIPSDTTIARQGRRVLMLLIIETRAIVAVFAGLPGSILVWTVGSRSQLGVWLIFRPKIVASVRRRQPKNVPDPLIFPTSVCTR